MAHKIILHYCISDFLTINLLKVDNGPVIPLLKYGETIFRLDSHSCWQCKFQVDINQDDNVTAPRVPCHTDSRWVSSFSKTAIVQILIFNYNKGRLQ